MTPDASIAAFRFGYGLPLPAGAPTDPAALLAALAEPDTMARTHQGTTMADQIGLMDASDDALKISRRAEGQTADEARQTYRTHIAALQTIALNASRACLARALDAPDGFRERLTAFWTDHFTTTATGRRNAAMPLAMVTEAIRPNLTGPFSALLTAAITHPAMLIYLDQTLSFGPASRIGKKRGKGLNENLARELMELHTLGAGSGYTQDDVRQMAELLTGLVVGKTGFRFDKRRAEPGAETILGARYEGDTLAPVLAALGDLAKRPETARHIARKLAVHFVSDTPDPGLVAAIEAAWLATDGNLMAAYAALLGHPAAWAEPMQKARQPFDFTIAALRALGLTGADLQRMGEGPLRRMILAPMANMGQPWQAAPGPDGWPEAAEAWITPQGMAARITWAMEVPGRLVTPLPDPASLLSAALGPRASDALRWAVPRSENIREGVGLIFASPEFNRR